jgi:mono/diheme cytochrome c family protein
MTAPRVSGRSFRVPLTFPVSPFVPAALATLVVSLAGCGSPATAPAPPMTPGARLYAANCMACHRADGSGIKGLQPALAGTPVTNGEPDVLLAWVMFGRRPAALPRGEFAGVMPQFGYLSDEDLATLLTHVRASFGNHAPPVTPAMVAAARAAHRLS